MLPPITYYGGKAKLAEQIAVMLREHTHYVESRSGPTHVTRPPKTRRTRTARREKSPSSEVNLELRGC